MVEIREDRVSWSCFWEITDHWTKTESVLILFQEITDHWEQKQRMSWSCFRKLLIIENKNMLRLMLSWRGCPTGWRKSRWLRFDFKTIFSMHVFAKHLRDGWGSLWKDQSHNSDCRKQIKSKVIFILNGLLYLFWMSCVKMLTGTSLSRDGIPRS